MENYDKNIESKQHTTFNKSAGIVSNIGGKNFIISGIRFMAMCLIIACHFCQYYGSEWAWWLNVGVQIFFIISGYLYGTKEIQEPISWLKRQFVKILIPYWICLTITLIGYFFVAPELLNLKSVIGAYLTLRTIKGISHLWFISYILFCYLITPYLSYLRDYLSKYSIISEIIIIIGIFGIYSISSVMMGAHFRSGSICCYMSGYFIAALQKRTKKDIIRTGLYVSIIPCLLLNAVYCYFRYCLPSKMPHSMMIHLTDYSHLCLGLVVTLFFMVFIRDIKNNRILQFSDNNSYEIYLVHQIFILSPFTLLGITEFPMFNVVITVIAIIFFGVLLHVTTNKFKARSLK